MFISYFDLLERDGWWLMRWLMVDGWSDGRLWDGRVDDGRLCEMVDGRRDGWSDGRLWDGRVDDGWFWDGWW